MTDSILVPMDDSEMAANALRHAIDDHPDADLTVVHAYGIETTAGRGSGIMLDDQVLEAAKEHAETVLERAREIATEEGYDGAIETFAAEGDPADVITEHAADADAIYIGTHGREGASRVLLGSVAEKVVRRSPVTVTVVK